MSLNHQCIQSYYWNSVSREDGEKVLALLELLLVRSGAYQLNEFFVSDVKVLIDSICTC